MQTKCSVINCPNHSDFTFSFIRGASICNQHYEKWCDMREGLDLEKNPEDIKLYLRRLRMWLNNLQEYKKEEDVNKFIDINNFKKNGGIIEPEQNALMEA